MEKAPFGLNRADNAFFKKVCKSVPVFAGNSGNVVSGGAIRGRSGPGLGRINYIPYGYFQPGERPGRLHSTGGSIRRSFLFRLVLKNPAAAGSCRIVVRNIPKAAKFFFVNFFLPEFFM
jgi:hypothetical protein